MKVCVLLVRGAEGTGGDVRVVGGNAGGYEGNAHEVKLKRLRGSFTAVELISRALGRNTILQRDGTAGKCHEYSELQSTPAFG